ncbi:MAG TPA: glutathione S-transferase [Rhodanobacteraceae bacterium]|nr:glutathione S-transferase [Rhodanobacteraceae bacterium]
MLRIYDFKGFPNPTRIRIALAEKNLAARVEFVHVDVPAAEHRRPAFLAKNPSGTVPVLELEDGTCITECTAITEYIDNLEGPPTLTGSGARERAVIHMMQRRAEAGLLDAAATYFHHATPGLGPHIEIYQNAAWGEKNRERALGTLHYLDGVLGRQPYLAGDTFSIADITAFAGCAYADIGNIEMPAALKNLKAWRARIAKRPSVLHA